MKTKSSKVDFTRLVGHSYTFVSHFGITAVLTELSPNSSTDSNVAVYGSKSYHDKYSDIYIYKALHFPYVTLSVCYFFVSLNVRESAGSRLIQAVIYLVAIMPRFIGVMGTYPQVQS